MKVDDREIIDPFEQLAIAWGEFKNEFESSKIGKFTIWLVDKLDAWIERFGK